MWRDRLPQRGPFIQALLAAGAAVLILLAVSPLRARASAGVSLNGPFTEWNGRPAISGSCGGPGRAESLAAFYWALDNNGRQLDFMSRRCTTNGAAYDGHNGERGSLRLRLYIDVGGDGSFVDAGDRILTLLYTPSNCPPNGGASGGGGNCASASEAVRWVLTDPAGRVLLTGQGAWGQSVGQGGLDCEWGVDLSLLGGGKVPLAMYVETPAERVPAHGTVLWTPVPALSAVLLGVVFLVGVWFAVRGKGWA